MKYSPSVLLLLQHYLTNAKCMINCWQITLKPKHMIPNTLSTYGHNPDRRMLVTFLCTLTVIPVCNGTTRDKFLLNCRQVPFYTGACLQWYIPHIPGLANLWHACTKWLWENFLGTQQSLLSQFFFTDQLCYILNNLCICMYIYMKTEIVYDYQQTTTKRDCKRIIFLIQTRCGEKLLVA
jgi:hypothetical protein